MEQQQSLQIDGDVLAAMFSQKDMEILSLRSQLKAMIEQAQHDEPVPESSHQDQREGK